MAGTGAARAWESRALVPLGPTQQPLSGRPHSRCREGKGLWLWGPRSASGGPRLDRRVALCLFVPKGLTLSPDRAAVRPSAMELCGLEQRPLLRGRWRPLCSALARGRLGHRGFFPEPSGLGITWGPLNWARDTCPACPRLALAFGSARRLPLGVTVLGPVGGHLGKDARWGPRRAQRWAMRFARAQDQRAEVESQGWMGSRLTLLSPLPADAHKMETSFPSHERDPEAAPNLIQGSKGAERKEDTNACRARCVLSHISPH